MHGSDGQEERDFLSGPGLCLLSRPGLRLFRRRQFFDSIDRESGGGHGTRVDRQRAVIASCVAVASCVGSHRDRLRREVGIDAAVEAPSCRIPAPVARAWDAETRMRHEDDDPGTSIERPRRRSKSIFERIDVLDGEEKDGGIEGARLERVDFRQTGDVAQKEDPVVAVMAAGEPKKAGAGVDARVEGARASDMPGKRSGAAAEVKDALAGLYVEEIHYGGDRGVAVVRARACRSSGYTNRQPGPNCGCFSLSVPCSVLRIHCGLRIAVRCRGAVVPPSEGDGSPGYEKAVIASGADHGLTLQKGD